MNLKNLRKQKNITQQNLAEKLNLSRAAINNYENGRAQPNFETLKKMSLIFNCTIDDLINESKTPLKKRGVKINVLGVIPAGLPIEAEENVIDTEEISEEMARQGTFFALRVKGNSMEPEIREGDVVILKQTNEAYDKDICAVMVNGYDATLKQVFITNTGLILKPFNKEYGDMHFDKKQVAELPVKIVGVAVEIRRTLKK